LSEACLVGCPISDMIFFDELNVLRGAADFPAEKLGLFVTDAKADDVSDIAHQFRHALINHGEVLGREHN